MTIDTEEVKTLITKNLSQVRSVKEIACKMGVSVETLRKKYRRKEHEPLSNFIIRARLTEMKRLLIKTDLSCCEICFHLGLRDDSGEKFFRRETGMAMEKFRIQHRIGNRKKKRSITFLPTRQIC
jgi:AraC-like DNA-binding protein